MLKSYGKAFVSESLNPSFGEERRIKSRKSIYKLR